MEIMELPDLLRALRRRWYWPVAAALIALLASFWWVSRQTPMYRSTAQLFVSASTASAQGASDLAAAQFANARVGTYPDLVTSPKVLDPVIDELGLGLDASQLARQVSATNPPQTVLIEVTATDSSPQQAALIANSTARNLAVTVQDLETPSARREPPIKVTLTNPATVPSAPFAPNKTTILGLALLAGLAAGVGGAFLRESLDRSIKGTAGLAEVIGGAPLGVIGFDATAQKKPLPALDERSMRSEAFRTIRTNLQYVDVDNPPRAVALTSSVPAEGKSTAACNLAITMAQAGLRVCLVEADLRRPKVAEYLGVESAVGLTDVLAGKLSLDEVLLPWKRNMLTLLACGPIPPNPSELLSSRHMKATLSKLKEQFDVVLLDSAPLLPVTDGAITAAAADGAIVMVRHGHTTSDQLLAAVESLDQVGARMLGAVLNYAPVPRRRGGYASGYGYGYGYRHRSGSGKSKLGRRSRKKDAAAEAPVPESQQASLGG